MFPESDDLLQRLLGQQRHENERLLARFKHCGDSLVKKRLVSHLAVFWEKAAALRFAERMLQLGYKTEVTARADVRWNVLFAREDDLTLASVDKFSLEALRAVVDEHGCYEGWMAFLASAQPSRELLDEQR